eukprot:gene25590-31277_t
MALSTLFGGDGPRIWTVKDMEDPTVLDKDSGTGEEDEEGEEVNEEEEFD